MPGSKVSLILTTYNSIENLRCTMESIAQQDYPDIEVVIKDGGSTDGTKEAALAYAAPGGFRYPVKVQSCSDHGIYDAMNQGYALSEGGIIAFFNDRFVRRDAVSLMVRAIEESGADGAHADLVYAGLDGRVVRYWHMGQGNIRSGWMPGHPTLYLRRQVYERYGLYRTDFRISSDYEFMVRILKNKAVRLTYVPEIIVSMYYGGTSTGAASGYWRGLREGHEALVSNGVHPALLADLLRTGRLALQFLRAKKGEKELRRLHAVS